MDKHFDIAGYAALWGKPFDPAQGRDDMQDGTRLVIAKGARYAPTGTPTLCFAHNQRQNFASVYDGSLKIWSDHLGLAFGAHVGEFGTFGLLSGICDGRYDKISAAWLIIESHREGDRQIITTFGIGEISITPAALSPDAFCWLGDTDPADLPGHSRALARHWRTGWQARTFAKARRQAPAANAQTRHRTVAPAGLVALMASPDWRQAARAQRQALAAMHSNQNDYALKGYK